MAGLRNENFPPVALPNGPCNVAQRHSPRIVVAKRSPRLIQDPLIGPVVIDSHDVQMPETAAQLGHDQTAYHVPGFEHDGRVEILRSSPAFTILHRGYDAAERIDRYDTGARACRPYRLGALNCGTGHGNLKITSRTLQIGGEHPHFAT